MVNTEEMSQGQHGECVFSIVIPTYNGRDKIPNLLTSIYRTSYSFCFEVIVVVDGSTDNTLEFLTTTNYPNLKIISQQNQGRAAARNRGAKEAQGEYLFFVDDDMRLKEGNLFAHLTHHQQHPTSVLVGKVEMDEKMLSTSFHFFQASLLQKWEKPFCTKTQIGSANFKFTTQHLSLPTQLFKALGGFDIRLTDAEDYDLAMRALAEKIPIYYDPSISAWHDDFMTCEKYIRRQIQYKSSHQQLTELGKQYLFEVFRPASMPSGRIKQGIVRFFAYTFWVAWVDKGYLSFLPKAVRYKLYATIIYTHTLRGLLLV